MAPHSDAADRVGAASARKNVIVGYAAPDLMWAEWTSEQLLRVGIQAELVEQDGSPDSGPTRLLERTGSDSAQCVLLLSNAYLAGAAAELSQVAWDNVDPGSVIPFIAGRCQIPPRLWMLSPVSLHDAGDGRTATARMLARILGSAQADAVIAGTADAPEPLTHFPGGRPRVWPRLIPLRNPHFTGRETLLRELRTQLRTGLTALHSLQGLGGVGKTQLAIEYAYRFQADYEIIWWIPAEDRAQARSALAELAPRLGLADGMETGEAIRAVRDVLRADSGIRNWLLIFDNAERPDDLAPLLLDGPGHTLVTTRDRSWAARAGVLDIDVYSRAEGVQFLRRRVPDLNEADATRLADELGNLPLVLEHAAAWLLATRTGPDRYLELLDQQTSQLFASLRPSGYPKAVATTWTVSLNKAREDNQAAAALLEACAFIGPNPIPLSLFTSASEEILPEELKSLARDEGVRAEALRLVQDYSLAKVSDVAGQGPSVQQHRFVQRMIKELLSPDQRAAYQATAHRLLATAERGDPEQRSNLSRYAALLPHVRSSGMTESIEPDAREAIFDHALMLQQVQGELLTGLDLLNAAAESWRGRVDELDPDMLTLDRRRANMLRGLGRLQDALAIDKAVYDRVVDSVGTEDPRAVRAASGLAASHRRLGHLREARELDEHTYRLAVEQYGPEHPEALRNSHNMALNFRISGEFEAALRLDDDNANSYARLYGPDNPDTLFARNNVARDLRECGKCYDSLALQEHTYAHYREIAGDESPETLRAMKNLSVSRRKAGRYTESFELATEVYERHRKKFGDEHLETLAATTNLANEYRCLARYAEGREIAERALELYRDTYGADNMFTLMAAVNLAALLRLAGAPDAARELNTETLPRLRDIFTSDHRYTLSCQVNLASDHAGAGDFETARDLGEDALARLRQVSGEDHQYTLACGLNLALDLESLGEETRSRELYDDVMARYKATLGATHPETKGAVARERGVCDIEPLPT